MIDLEQVADILTDIQRTTSTLGKEALLSKYADVVGVKEILKFIFDPYFTTGIGKKKLNNAQIIGPHESHSPEFIMHYLKTHCTGDTVDVAIAAMFIEDQETDNARWLAEGIVTKDLQIGVSVTTLNKVYDKGFIPKIGIMRGMHCPINARGNYIATEKIDGNRRLIMNKATGVEIYTRSGKRDYGLVEIEEQAKLLPVGHVYDTECIAVGDFADNIEVRQASASILNSKGKRTGVKACIFDMLPQVDYDAGRSKMAAVFRKYLIALLFGDLRGMEMLKELMTAQQFAALSSFIRSELHFNEPETPNIISLPILGVVHSYTEAVAMAGPIWETGGEGIMLVEAASAYEVNPNPRPTLLKIKQTKEYTVLCTNVLEGINKYTGTLGSIEVQFKATNGIVYYLKVGSGFADYQRDDFWQHPWKIIGKKVEIESFGESRNQNGVYSLNCPIFKRIVGEVD